MDDAIVRFDEWSHRDDGLGIIVLDGVQVAEFVFIGSIISHNEEYLTTAFISTIKISAKMAKISFIKDKKQENLKFIVYRHRIHKRTR